MQASIIEKEKDLMVFLEKKLIGSLSFSIGDCYVSSYRYADVRSNHIWLPGLEDNRLCVAIPAGACKITKEFRRNLKIINKYLMAIKSPPSSGRGVPFNASVH